MDFSSSPRRVAIDVGMLSVVTPSFALTFSSRDRVIYVFAKLGFFRAQPVLYFDVKNYVTYERNRRQKKEVNTDALREAVFHKAATMFDGFYIVTDEDQDYLVKKLPEQSGVSKEAHRLCLALDERVVAMEDFFEFDDQI